jgi:cell division protein FtsB
MNGPDHMPTATAPEGMTAVTKHPPQQLEQRWLRHRVEHRWLRTVLALVAMIVLADALVGEQSLSSERRARRRYAAAGEELASLRGKNARLREEVRRLREDPETIEFVARKDLGLARRGEILVVLK